MPTFASRGPMVQDSVMDIALSLQNEEWVRQLSVGSSWTTLRVGMLTCIGPAPGGGLAGIPAGYGFVMGFCSGTANPYGSGATTNFVGVNFGVTSGWGAYYGYGNVYPFYRPSSCNAIQKFGATLTTSASIDGGSFGVPPFTIAARRGMIIVEVTKQNPNFSVSTFWPLSIGNVGGYESVTVDFTVDELKSAVAQLDNITLRSGTIGFQRTNRVIAGDETSGLLNTVDIYSTLTQYGLDIYEVAVEKLA